MRMMGKTCEDAKYILTPRYNYGELEDCEESKDLILEMIEG